jgi:hypothetical protein
MSDIDSSFYHEFFNNLHTQHLDVSQLKNSITLLSHQHNYSGILLSLLQHSNILELNQSDILELTKHLCQLGCTDGFYTGSAISWMKLYQQPDCVDYLLSIGAKNNRTQFFCLSTDNDYINYCTNLYTNYGSFSTEILRNELLQGKVVSSDGLFYHKTFPIFSISFSECKLERLIDILYSFENFSDDYLLQTVVQYNYRLLIKKLFKTSTNRNDNLIIVHAVRQNNIELLTSLLSLGLKFTSPSKFDILSIAIRLQNLTLVKFILKYLDSNISPYSLQCAIGLGSSSDIYKFITQ